MHGYIAIYRGKRFEVRTDKGKYAAQTIAARAYGDLRGVRFGTRDAFHPIHFGR